MDLIHSSGNEIIWVATVVIALGILHKLALGAYRLTRKIHDTFDLVHHELKPNAGSSLRDAVDRIEVRLAALEHPKVEVHIEKEEP